MTLVEVDTCAANGIDEETPEEWEEVEFLVDSGASATAIGPDSVKAVSPSDPNPSKKYRLAGGSPIPNRGEKSFHGLTEEGIARRLKAQVTDVDRPLMSVAQIMQNGGRAAFDKTGSDVEGGGQKIALTCEGGLYKLTMWVRRGQSEPVNKFTRAFHRQA